MRTPESTSTLLLVLAPLVSGACFDEPAPSGTSEGAPTTESGEEEMGDGDGDPATGDGDGDSSDGDGDGDDPSTSETDTGDGDGDEVPVCGDGVVDEGEVCDDGPDPQLADGACKPDCSGLIETRMVVKGASLSDGDLGPNPVAALDAQCTVGYAAMFSDGVSRRATTTPWASVDSIDWPIQPYTRYVNVDGEEVWITDDVALLGVRDGAHIDVLHPLGESQVCPMNICSNYRMLSGLKEDGTTLNANNCNGWSDASPNLTASIGSFATGTFASNSVDCDFSWMFIPSFQQPLCVEL